MLAGAEGVCLRISDFDFDPASGVLYGVGIANDDDRDGLFTITIATPPVATLVGLLIPAADCTGNECLRRGGLAFRDDGALFLASIQEQFAQLDKAKVFERPIVTTVSADTGFYAAEDYHQDFLVNNPDNPYIVFNDLPKVHNLEKLFPRIYLRQPVTVYAANATR